MKLSREVLEELTRLQADCEAAEATYQAENTPWYVISPAVQRRESTRGTLMHKLLAHAPALLAGAQRVEELEEILVSVKNIDVADGRATATFDGEAVRLFAAECVGWFRESGGVNYVETVVHADGERYLLTMQRAEGKTPGEMKSDAEVQNAKLVIENHRLRARVAELETGGGR